MRYLTGLYNIFLMGLGIVCFMAKMAVNLWMICFLGIIGAIGFITAFGFTVFFFVIIIEVIKVYR